VGVPLSRRSAADIHRLVIERGISEASPSTILRWLAEDAIKPWQHRSWIFPSDPLFLEKAGPVLDLYQGRFEGRLLHPGEFVISADEKPSIQARQRIHEPVAPGPGHGQRRAPPDRSAPPSACRCARPSAAAGTGRPGCSDAQNPRAGSPHSSAWSGR